jgi:trigger factor
MSERMEFSMENQEVKNLKLNVEEQGETKKLLRIEVPSHEIDPELQKAYQNFQKHVVLPGFRKGKVPLNVIRKRYQREVEQDMLERILPHYYEKAVKMASLEPVDMPIIRGIQLHEGEPFKFDATVYVKPKFEVRDYRGLPILKTEIEVSDEMVDNVLREFQDRSAELSSYEDEKHKVEEGDVVEVDFEGFIDGDAFPGNKGESQLIEIGSGRRIPGFEEGFVGMKKGEEKEIETSFPDEYHTADLAGKTAVFKVVVKDIKEKNLPALDDEFAKDVGEQFSSLEELRKGIRERIEKGEKKKVRDGQEAQIMEALIQRNVFEVPEVMVERHKRSIIEGMMRPGEDLESVKKELDQEEIGKRAERDVAWSLISEQIAAKENIALSDDEFAKHMEKLASENSMTTEVFQELYKNQIGSLEPLRLTLLNEKILDFLIENATVTEEGSVQDQQ